MLGKFSLWVSLSSGLKRSYESAANIVVYVPGIYAASPRGSAEYTLLSAVAVESTYISFRTHFTESFWWYNLLFYLKQICSFPWTAESPWSFQEKCALDP